MHFQQIYAVAEDFVNLSFMFKIAIAFDMELLGSDHFEDTPEEWIEVMIWQDAIEDNRLSEFIDLVEFYSGKSA